MTGAQGGAVTPNAAVGTAATRIANLWWCSVPARLGRASRTLALLFVDGSYVLVWPVFAAAIVPVLFVAAFLAGALHPLMSDSLYSSSLLVLAALALPGLFGSGFGAWTVLGYALGDFVINRRAGDYVGCFDCNLAVDFARVREPMLLSYVLLAGLVVLVPFVAGTLRHQVLGRIEAAIRPSVIPRAVGQAISQGLLVMLWTTVFPPLIRPFFSWTGASPDTVAIRSVQVDGWVLIVLGAAAGACRILVESWASSRAERAAALRSCHARVNHVLPHRWPRLPLIVRAPLTGALVTLLVAGVIDDWLGAALLFVVFSLSVALRSAVGRVAPWSRLMNRVPLAIRLAVGAVASYLIGLAVVGAAGIGESFFPIVAASALAMPVMVLLLPPRTAPGAPRPGLHRRPPPAPATPAAPAAPAGGSSS